MILFLVMLMYGITNNGKIMKKKIVMVKLRGGRSTRTHKSKKAYDRKKMKLKNGIDTQLSC